MLSIGWPEMMLVAAAALIIVGPRDLPALLRSIGQMAGRVRRMGNEFKSELNKVAALDDVKDIKKSITQPLTDSRKSIESEFNKVTATGFEPTGALKPKDPNSESVYDEIKSATADISKMPDADAVKDNLASEMQKAQAEAVQKVQVKKVATPKGTTKAAPRKSNAKPKAAAKKPVAAKTTAKATTAKAASRRSSAGSTKAKPAQSKTTPARKPATKTPATPRARRTADKA